MVIMGVIVRRFRVMRMIGIDLCVSAQLAESLCAKQTRNECADQGQKKNCLNHYQPFIMLMSSTAMVPRLR